MTSPSQEIARAEADYRRLRNAYLELARGENNEVGMAMVGADMERAHVLLQSLTGLPERPFTHEPTQVVRREARRMAEEESA